MTACAVPSTPDVPSAVLSRCTRASCELISPRAMAAVRSVFRFGSSVAPFFVPRPTDRPEPSNEALVLLPGPLPRLFRKCNALRASERNFVSRQGNFESRRATLSTRENHSLIAPLALPSLAIRSSPADHEPPFSYREAGTFRERVFNRRTRGRDACYVTAGSIAGWIENVAVKVCLVESRVRRLSCYRATILWSIGRDTAMADDYSPRKELSNRIDGDVCVRSCYSDDRLAGHFFLPPFCFRTVGSGVRGPAIIARNASSSSLMPL